MGSRLGRTSIFLLCLGLYGLLLFVGIPRLVRSIPLGQGEMREAFIPQGVTAFEAAMELSRQGFVDNPQALARWMTRFGIDRRLKPGLYHLKAGSPWEVARQLRQAKAEQIQVTLIPGMDLLALERYFPALTEDDNFPVDLRPLLPERAEDRLLFLLPETYQIVPGAAEEEQVVRQASRLWKERIDFSGLASEDLLQRGIIASIVEKEIRRDDERGLAASVFLNRIQKGMPLQSCATVVFAWKRRGIELELLSHEDLKIDSPFNTYIHRGLPPHPIALPSLSSWLGALAPPETDYLFFVAQGDGGHIFTKSYKEHLEAQRRQPLSR